MPRAAYPNGWYWNYPGKVGVFYPLTELRFFLPENASLLTRNKPQLFFFFLNRLYQFFISVNGYTSRNVKNVKLDRDAPLLITTVFTMTTFTSYALVCMFQLELQKYIVVIV